MIEQLLSDESRRTDITILGRQGHDQKYCDRFCKNRLWMSL